MSFDRFIGPAVSIENPLLEGIKAIDPFFISQASKAEAPSNAHLYIHRLASINAPIPPFITHAARDTAPNLERWEPLDVAIDAYNHSVATLPEGQKLSQQAIEVINLIPSTYGVNDESALQKRRNLLDFYWNVSGTSIRSEIQAHLNRQLSHLN